MLALVEDGSLRPLLPARTPPRNSFRTPSAQSRSISVRTPPQLGAVTPTPPTGNV
jgi:hypothetical protein